MSPPASPPAVLTVKAELAADAIVVTYRLTNADPHFGLLSFDAAAGVGAPPADLSAQVYVSFQPPSTVSVKRVRPPNPAGYDITRVFVPLMARVAPGATREVSFRLPLPLRERSQYFPHYEGAEYRVQRVRALAVTIGYHREVEGTVVDVVDDATGMLRLRAAGDEQRLVTATVPLASEVDLLVRVEDHFQRI